MLILHGSLIENSFLVWAEDSDSPFLSEMPSRPSPSDEWTGTDYGPQQASPPDSGAAVAPPHGAFTRYLPFSATTKRLRDTLTAGVPFLSIARRQNGQIVVSIPSIGGVPCASSHMIAPVPKLDSGSLGLLHWKVSALRLDPIQIIDLLSYCADRELIAEGLAVGADISFWAGALRFAASLVARQQYLPGVSCEGEHPVAQWQPVFLGDDAARLGELARSMPLSCAAIGISAGSVDSSRTTELLARFITWCTDYLVRSACRTDAAQRRQIEIFQLEPGSSSIHSRWLVALFADDPTVAGTAEEISLLLSAIRDWQRPLKLVSDSPYRLCFRIEEPAPDTVPDSPADVELAEQADLSFSPEDAAPSEADCNNGDGVPPVISEIVRETCAAGSWYVRFLLQSIEEPSCEMVVPDFLYGQRLERISGDLGDLSPRELLLSLLGRAAKICPKIDESLTDSCPRGFYLSSEEAYDFLARVGPQLKGSGFSVQLPGWWVQRKPPLSASIKMSELNRGQALLSLHDLQEFDWTVALGGAEMSVSQLEDLVRLNIRLLRVQGRWLELDPQVLDSLLKFLRRRKKERATTAELLRLGLGGVSLPEGVEFGGIKGEGRVVELLAQLQGKRQISPVAPHSNFRGRLRPYQERGLSWLSFLSSCGLGACLADDMGLGKTVQTLAFIQKLWYERKKAERRPTLLVCPMSVLGNWQAEIARFTPDLPCLIHHGTGRLRGEELIEAARRYAVTVTSYALLNKDREDLKEVNWLAVILDEAQNIKNPEAKQARAAFEMPADVRVALTGTPVENSVGDLWSIMNFLNPGFLGSQLDFKQRFYWPIQMRQDGGSAEELRRLTAPLILRRQEKSVQVHKFICSGTLEEKIDELIERKELVASQTITAGEGWLTELSTAELRDLFALREHAFM